ncbi:tRNA-specific 2-thiouridylase MnmA [Clostridia bacterium]|nr:tRNA-specific 2-thiouridylase MnmA [Clostridia bacterium]
MSKALIAMSGGVDSSVAAYLSKSAGYDCIGTMMKLYDGENGCCSAEDAEDARAVAASLDIPFYVFNFKDDFDAKVIRRFVDAYKNGRTPNPCIDCNRFLKFERLLNRAAQIECGKIVTGHYARIQFDDNRYILKKGVDETKDQSYVLYAMTQSQLSRTLLPVGALRKSEVREIALERRFVNAKKRDSQDICFVSDKDYSGFIRRYTGEEFPKGDFLDTDGNVIGRHNGIICYTIGQRKGIGLTSPAPLYVCGVSPEKNTVTLGNNEDLYSKFLEISDINLIPFDNFRERLTLKVKIRYKQKEQPAYVWQTSPTTVSVEFFEPQRAVTKGQSAVLYADEIVIGGGTIN